MRNYSTISFLGVWEQIHNPNFKPIKFDRFKSELGDNAFTLTLQQWIKALKQNLIEDTGNSAMVASSVVEFNMANTGVA